MRPLLPAAVFALTVFLPGLAAAEDAAAPQPVKADAPAGETPAPTAETP